MHKVSTPASTEVQQHIFTLPNAMTAVRAAMAVVLPLYVLRGGKHPTTLYGMSAALDMEGHVARLIDTFAPGWGTSTIGKQADPIADTLLGVGGMAAIATSPRSSGLAKVSAAISMVKVAKQSAWAVEAQNQHKDVFDELYEPKVGWIGKTGTFAMFVGQALALSTIELGESGRDPKLRNAAGAVSIGLSVAGLVLGGYARKQYDQDLDVKIQDHLANISLSK